MSSTQSPLPAERSEFVTVLAWIFIGLSGFMTLTSVFQYFAFGMMMSFGPMQEGMNEMLARMPAAAFVFRHFRLLIGTVVLLSLITLVASIGLLKRWNWARQVFIGLMAVGIIWNIAGTIVQFMILRAMPMLPLPPDAPAEFRDLFEAMMSSMRIFSVIFALGFCLLYGWIIVRLMSAKVRSEFA
jgi:hypothetical protein